MTAADIQRLLLAVSLFDAVIDQLDQLTLYVDGDREAAEILRKEKIAVSASVGRIRMRLEQVVPAPLRGGQHRSSPGDLS